PRYTPLKHRPLSHNALRGRASMTITSVKLSSGSQTGAIPVGVTRGSTLPQGLPNIYANLLNGIVPIAEPIPLWRVGLCSACHIRRPSGNLYGTGSLKAGDELPSLPA